MAFEMGLGLREFWVMTPLNFIRMQAAYRKRQEMAMWPLRRIEAAIWNVQIAKTKSTQIDAGDLYPLAIDGTRKKARKPRGILSKEAYWAMMQAQQNQQTSPDASADEHTH